MIGWLLALFGNWRLVGAALAIVGLAVGGLYLGSLRNAAAAARAEAALQRQAAISARDQVRRERAERERLEALRQHLDLARRRLRRQLADARTALAAVKDQGGCLDAPVPADVVGLLQ